VKELSTEKKLPAAARLGNTTRQSMTRLQGWRQQTLDTSTLGGSHRRHPHGSMAATATFSKYWFREREREREFSARARELSFKRWPRIVTFEIARASDIKSLEQRALVWIDCRFCLSPVGLQALILCTENPSHATVRPNVGGCNSLEGRLTRRADGSRLCFHKATTPANTSLAFTTLKEPAPP
jgi:hypothetical protein